MSGRLTYMKYTAVIAVAVFSLLVAIPLSHTTAQQRIDLSFKPVEAKVAVTPVAKPTVTHTASALPPAQPTPVVPPQPCDTHECLMAKAGISTADFAAVDYIVSHESGWDADATEPTSGAHGLPQALPYSKTGCGWDDAVCQLQWASNYAVSRYGGWWQAQAHWAVYHNW